MSDYDILETFCEVHHVNLRGRDCDECWGEGGYHDCGEDCCCCADPDEPNRRCENCAGTGRVKWCPGWTKEEPCNKGNWVDEDDDPTVRSLLPPTMEPKK